MSLIKYKLGDLLYLEDERNTNNSYSLSDVKGISIQKIFIETKANMEDVSLSPYILVKPDFFAYVTVTSRNGEKITIAHNTTFDTYIVSSSYVVFSISRPDLLDSDYLFMYFNRPEFDRYSRFNSWGSARETFSWEDMCFIDIELPPLPIQQKYVNVYKAMLANQQCYEHGMEELRTVCDGHFDFVKKMETVSLGDIIEKVDVRNTDGLLGEDEVRGITNKKQFDDTKADLAGTDLTKFLVIDKDVFAYNSRTDGRDMLVLALNRADRSIIVTWNYNAFKVRKEKRATVNPEYLYAFFKRSEFDRNVRFNSWGSSQELLSWDNLCNMRVPCPDISVQDSIAEINRVYLTRKEINETLKTQIKKICPVLINGSIEEARKEA